MQYVPHFTAQVRISEFRRNRSRASALILGCGVWCLACTGCNPPQETIPAIMPTSGVTDALDTSEETLPVHDSDSTTETAAENAAEVEGSLASPEVTLASYEDLLKNVQRFTGKVVVVDVWSTSCIPCMREFPNLVQLSKSYPDQVACISMNVDYIGIKRKPPESYLPKAKEFLTKQKALFTNLVSSDTDTEVLEKLEVGSLPAIIVFDSQGKVAQRFTDSNSGEDGLTYEGDVIPKVKELVAQLP